MITENNSHAKQQLIDLIKRIEQEAENDAPLKQGFQAMRETAEEWQMDFYDFAIIKMCEWSAERRAKEWLKNR